MQSTLAAIIEDFALFPDWESRYTYLLDLAKTMPPLRDDEKVSENQVRGCTSQVWLTSAWNTDGTLDLHLDSDALIVRGLLALVHAAFHNQSASAILSLNLSEQLAATGLLQNLSPNRRNGFASVISRVQHLAQQHATQTSGQIAAASL